MIIKEGTRTYSAPNTPATTAKPPKRKHHNFVQFEPRLPMCQAIVNVTVQVRLVNSRVRGDNPSIQLFFLAIVCLDIPKFRLVNSLINRGCHTIVNVNIKLRLINSPV